MARKRRISRKIVKLLLLVFSSKASFRDSVFFGVETFIDNKTWPLVFYSYVCEIPPQGHHLENKLKLWEKNPSNG